MTDEDKITNDEPVSEELDEQEDEETADGVSGDDGDEKESLQDELKRVVGVQLEDVATLRKKLTVTIPRETLDRRLDDQYTELRRDAMVPGFRRGRAPRRLLERRFGSEVGETLVQQLVSAGYVAAVEKEELKIIGDPLVWAKEKGAESETLMEVQKAIATMELPDDGDMSFACGIEIRPEFELPELENIPVARPVISISDEDVKLHLDRVLAGHGTYEPAGDDAVQTDDVITADVKMTSGDTVLKEQDGVNLAARPQQVDGVNLADLGKTLEGHKVGDVVTAAGEIGDDYVKEEFRGKQATFEFTIKDIRRLKVPELNEEFVKSWGFESENELRDWLRQDLESRLGEEIKRGMGNQVYRYLLENTSFDVPARLSERQTDRVLTRRMLEMYEQGVPSQEVEKHLDALKTTSREDTVRDLKIFFIMEALSEKIEVDVAESELNGVIASIAQRQGRRFDRVRDELAKGDRLMNLYLQIRDRKIIDQLLEKALVTEKTPEELKAAEVSDKGGTAGSSSKKGGSKKTAKEKTDENADET